MTSLLTDGLVARATTSRCRKRRFDEEGEAARDLSAWHGTTRHWPWEPTRCEPRRRRRRAADFDIIHYEAAYYPIRSRSRGWSPTPIVQTCITRRAPPMKLWLRYPNAVRRHLQRAGAPLSGLNIVGTCCTESIRCVTYREKPAIIAVLAV